MLLVSLPHRCPQQKPALGGTASKSQSLFSAKPRAGREEV